MEDKIVLIVSIMTLFLIIFARYNHTKEYSQCFYAWDVVTCMEVIRSTNER